MAYSPFYLCIKLNIVKNIHTFDSIVYYHLLQLRYIYVFNKGKGCYAVLRECQRDHIEIHYLLEFM